MKRTEKTLLNRLAEYNETAVPMHMPGHKRNTRLLKASLPYEIDITEIDGFDNLHDMNGVLKETAALAASLYGSKAAFPLVGGSTCGILAAVHALAAFGSHVLIARNCHKSVFHAVELMGLYPHYVCPKPDGFGICGKITPEAIKSALCAERSIRLVIVTSPTYEGVISDIANIAAVCHENGALLLVDSAHGAHLGFSPRFCASAVSSGADAVVMSLHKTMPALTQTALLHICTDAVDKNKISEALSIFETSSPSYVLLSSIDACLRFISQDGEALFSALYENLSFFYKETNDLKALSVLQYDDFSKLIISTKNTALTGTGLADILRNQFHIEVEMTGIDYILAISSICDSKENLMEFAAALKEIDAEIPVLQTEVGAKKEIVLPQMQETPSAARQRCGEFVPLSCSEGRECLEYVWAYPPGIPLIVPGERIDRRFIETAEDFAQAKIPLKSTKGLLDNKIWVRKK